MAKFFRTSISLAITALFLFLIFRFIDLQKFWQSIQNVNYFYLGVATVLYILVYLVRAQRMDQILGYQNLPRMYFISIIHYFLNKMLPMRTGELSLPLLLKRYTDCNFKKGLSLLVLLRVMDVGVILTYFLISTFFIKTPWIALYQRWLWLVVLIILGIFGTLLGGERLVQRQIRIKNYRWFVLGLIRDSFLNWLLFYGFIWFMVQAFRVQFNFGSVIFAATFSVLSMLVPVSAIGNFGTFEAGWVLGFVLLGMGQGAALAIGFATNVFLTLINAVLASIGYWYLENDRLK